MSTPSDDQWPRLPGRPSKPDAADPEPADPEPADPEPRDPGPADDDRRADAVHPEFRPAVSEVSYTHHTITYGQSSTSRSTRAVGWIFVAVGVVCLLAMGIPALALATKPLRTGWSAAEATVIAVRVEGSGEDQLYTAVLEYQTRSGAQQCELQSALRSTFPKGLALPVRYNRAEPSLCRYSPTDVPGWVGWMHGGMGVGFLLIFGGVGVGVLRSQAARG